MTGLVQQQPRLSAHAASRRTHSLRSRRSELIKASCASGQREQSAPPNNRTASRRFLASASSAATRAAAPSALSAGLFKSAWVKGGHRSGMIPPVNALAGLSELLRNCPAVQL